MITLVKFVVLFGLPFAFCTNTYNVTDEDGVGRRFDGIGGLSGGGVIVVAHDYAGNVSQFSVLGHFKVAHQLSRTTEKSNLGLFVQGVVHTVHFYNILLYNQKMFSLISVHHCKF